MMDKYLLYSSLPHLAFDSLRYILNVSSKRDGFYDTSFKMPIIFKLENIENNTEPAKEFEIFTTQGLKGVLLYYKY